MPYAIDFCSPCISHYVLRLPKKWFRNSVNGIFCRENNYTAIRNIFNHKCKSSKTLNCRSRSVQPVPRYKKLRWDLRAAVWRQTNQWSSDMADCGEHGRCGHVHKANRSHYTCEYPQKYCKRQKFYIYYQLYIFTNGVVWTVTFYVNVYIFLCTAYIYKLFSKKHLARNLFQMMI